MVPSLPHLPELASTGPDDHFAIYVRDHLAGSAGGLALIRRTLDNNRGTDYEPMLRRLEVETRADRVALERLADHAGVAPSYVKQAAAWTAEKVARLKRNGRLVGYSPLARLWELEQLAAAVSTKTELWILMADERLADRVPTDVDAPAVLARCRGHVELVEEHRRRAGFDALAPTSS